MNVKNEKIKNCEDISNKLWAEGKDDFEHVDIGGYLNKDNIKQFVWELEDFLNKWNWEIFNGTERIEKNRSR